MDVFWLIIMYSLFICFGIGTIYFAIEGFVRLPMHEKVCGSNFMLLVLFFGLLVCVAGWTGMFGRGESSPVPWRAFIIESKKHGTFEGVFSFFLVIVVDLWLLWIPANIWVNSQKNGKAIEEMGYEASELFRKTLEGEDDKDWELYKKGYRSAYYELNKHRKYMARIINLLAGLLLMTAHNPIYEFISGFAD